MEPKIAIEVRRVADGIAALDIRGEMTGEADESLDEASAKMAELKARVVLLDFGGLTYMNYRGVGLLVRLEASARGQGRRLVAVGLNDHYRRVFHVTGPDEGIPVFASEAQAVAEAQAT